jgi:pSer/pThr/pTyr-binding forkhead associated (FHA) protein
MSANSAMLANAAMRAADGQAVGRVLEVVLEPVSHPELGEIRIGESLFAVGRTEPPFASYTSDAVSELSRRHARIFSEGGVAYIADLGSKNGTSVNGIDIREKMSRLHDGDIVSFGKTLSYRVHLRARAGAIRREERLASLTLQPEHGDLGLQPIVITNFPFLISKADAAFARYKQTHPDQVNYLSRRHAHVFLKDGKPFIEDLGSTNGTFVDGKRLDEHARPLKEGDVLAFGGHHFVYKVSLQTETDESMPTVTTLSPPKAAPVDADKTTFVAAADSFLDIFCVDHAPAQEDAVNADAETSSTPAKPGKRRGKVAIFLSELSGALSDGKRPGVERMVRWGGALAGTLAVLVIGAYLAGTPERELKDLIARGNFAQAAQLASRHMEESPDSAADFGALGTEALLKADVPKWMGMLKARDFAGARTVVADMKRLGRSNPGVQSLVDEVEWIGDVEQFVAERGGADVPARNPEDEARRNAFVKQWNEGTQAHQSAFAAISSQVPEFRDRYAETLSHLRKLALAGGNKDGGSDQGQDGGQRPAPEVGDGSAGRP